MAWGAGDPLLRLTPVSSAGLAHVAGEGSALGVSSTGVLITAARFMQAAFSTFLNSAQFHSAFSNPLVRSRR